MTEGLGFEPEDEHMQEALGILGAQLPPIGEGMVRRPDVHDHPEHLDGTVEGCPACGHGQQEGLTQAAALTRLRELGVSDLAAVQAIEMAPATGDGIAIVDGHMVSFAERYGWAVTPQATRHLNVEPVRADPADLYDLAWVLRVVEIVDRHLDKAAPPLYRVLDGDSPETAQVKQVLNRWRRLAAGPASEGQESVDQLNLLTGGNPRKGVVGTEDDVLLELGDTVGAALFAIQSITKDTTLTWQWVLAALSKALNRVPAGELTRAVQLIDHPGDDDFPPVMQPAGLGEAPGRPPGYCGDCWRSGVGACDAFPDCPNGRNQAAQRS